MSEKRTPTKEDFRVFFQTRLKHLTHRQELIWLSDVVPVEALAAAYPLGIFPWPGDDPELFPWVSPQIRGVLPLENFHLGKSTKRQIQKAEFTITFDKAFADVIQACNDAHEPESWIHPQMREAYMKAHHEGFAHSVDVWKDGELVGGLYGIDSDQFFSGESMFHKIPNAGKAAIRFIVEKLQARGDTFLDIQQLTPHMQAMGAEIWSREKFLKRIHNG